MKKRFSLLPLLIVVIISSSIILLWILDCIFVCKHCLFVKYGIFSLCLFGNNILHNIIKTTWGLTRTSYLKTIMVPLLLIKTITRITMHPEPWPLITSEIWKLRPCPPSYRININVLDSLILEEINVFELNWIELNWKLIKKVYGLWQWD